MGIRESLNQQNPKVVLGVTAGVVLVIVVFLVWYERGSGGGGAGIGPGGAQAYFSVDDGKSWFLDDASKLPPFDRGGKEAVRAYLYRCGDNGTPFIAFLERYTPEEKKRRQAAAQQEQSGSKHMPAPLLDTAAGTEIKVPGGQGSWIKQSDPRARAIMMPKCPDGGNAQIVLP